MKAKNDAAARIMREKLLDSIKAGFVPWRVDWSKEKPVQTIDGNVYRGINFFILTSQKQTRGFESPIFATFKKIAECGGWVRKGEHGNAAFFWTKDRREIRRYTLFNLDQTEGIAPGAVCPRLSDLHGCAFDSVELPAVDGGALLSQFSAALIAARLGRSNVRPIDYVARSCWERIIADDSAEELIYIASLAQAVADETLSAVAQKGVAR